MKYTELLLLSAGLMILLSCSPNNGDPSLARKETAVPRTIHFKNWALDLDSLKLLSPNDTAGQTVLWNIDQEPGIWKEPSSRNPDTLFAVGVGKIRGYLVPEDRRENNVHTGYCLSFYNMDKTKKIWKTNPGTGSSAADYLQNVIYEDRVIVALFSPIASGCGLVCINIYSGEIVWRAEVVQLMIPHSQYSNDVFLNIIGDKVILAAQEAGGAYIQVFDVATGKRLFSTTDLSQ
jgi:hypothetical protein